MGIKKMLNRSRKNEQKELEEKQEKFRVEVNALGKKYDCAIVPIMTKYGLEVEIQVLKKEDMRITPVDEELKTQEQEAKEKKEAENK